MARWTDLADWYGPTPNEGPKMGEWRGVVIHIAEGYYEGTIAWQLNPVSDVSSHFIVAKDGRIAQMVDTSIAAWTQRDGNGEWLSIENEGFVPSALTSAQIEANAAILARAHREYGVPLQVTTSPTGRGLGHHSMGAENGFNWGHSQCPGPAIVAQKSEIVSRAIAITSGVLTGEEHMYVLFTDAGKRHLGDFITRRVVSDSLEEEDIKFIAAQTGASLRDWGPNQVRDPDAFGHLQQPAVLSDAQVEQIAQRLVAASDNPLGPADQPAIVSAVKRALSEGTD